MKKNILLVCLAGTLIYACDNTTAEKSNGIKENENKAIVKEDPDKFPKGNHARNEQNEDTLYADMPIMTFVEEQHHFGKIKDGDKVSHSFEFTNTGKSDLIITNVRASCGCTVPTYTEKPVKPGEKGYIDVSFNSKGKVGNPKKSVTISANTVPATKVIYIMAEVVAADK